MLKLNLVQTQVIHYWQRTTSFFPLPWKVLLNPMWKLRSAGKLPPLTHRAVLAHAVPQSSYPPEYDPFDRPVGEVVGQLFDDTQPVNAPPAKRQR